MKKYLFLFIILSCSQKDQLKEMNNVPLPDYKELKSFSGKGDTLKVVIIGNSITTHPKALEIGWNHESGMAASSENNDYVHILFNRLKTTHRNIILRYSNYSDFERDPNNINLNDKKIIALKNFHPNLLIYQLGDNLSPENNNLFKSKSIELLNTISAQNSIVLSPYFKTKENFSTSKFISVGTKSKFIDTSFISDDIMSKAKNDSINQHSKHAWKAEGIGEHPGNKGMILISDIIFDHL